VQGNTHLHSRYRPHTTASMARSTAGIATTMFASMQAWIQTRACITPLSATSWGDGTRDVVASYLVVAS
jgi:hypothetical protein